MVRFKGRLKQRQLSEIISSFLGYLKRMECNFICVNWSAMAVGELGYVAENYVPIAGQLTGQFINFLNEHGTPLASMHIIAHR